MAVEGVGKQERIPVNESRRPDFKTTWFQREIDNWEQNCEKETAGTMHEVLCTLLEWAHTLVLTSPSCSLSVKLQEGEVCYEDDLRWNS